MIFRLIPQLDYFHLGGNIQIRFFTAVRDNIDGVAVLDQIVRQKNHNLLRSADIQLVDEKKNFHVNVSVSDLSFLLIIRKPSNPQNNGHSKYVKEVNSGNNPPTSSIR